MTLGGQAFEPYKLQCSDIRAQCSADLITIIRSTSSGGIFINKVHFRIIFLLENVEVMFLATTCIKESQ